MPTAATAARSASDPATAPAPGHPGADPEPGSPDGVFGTAFEALTVGVLVCTPEGDHANGALRRIWRVGADDPLDRAALERSLRPLPDTRPLGGSAVDGSFRPVRAAIARQATPATRVGVVRGDGSNAVVRLVVQPIAVGRGRGAVLSAVDETAAYEVERLRDAFLGIVGHELRSPISSVLSAADLLRGGGLEPDVAAEVAADLGSEAQRLHELVEQLLRLADLERLGIAAGDEPVQLRNLARRTIRRWKQRRPRLQIELESPAEVPPVAGEDGYITQALDVLLDNAAKFAGSSAPIIVRIEAVDGEVRLHVLDEGPGIRDGDAGSIFELFHRARGRRPAEEGPSGHGIGLFVARAIVGALGGRMWAESRPDRGADVGFALPIATE
jgi:K+-sensing histidine kinase KdpD